jgi:superfamily II DNA or RNA helicase
MGSDGVPPGVVSEGSRLQKDDIDKVAVILRTYLKIRVVFKNNPVIERKIVTALTLHKRVTTRSFRGVKYDVEYVNLFKMQKRGDETIVLTGAGFIPRLRKLFAENGMKTIVKDVVQMDARAEEALTINTKWTDSIVLREEQTEVLDQVKANRYGQFIAATGSGKTFLIRYLCKMYGKSRILITTYSLKLLADIQKDLVAIGINAGMYTSKSKDTCCRVQLCSVDSLSNLIDKSFDILIMDERHELCTDKRMKTLLNVKARRCYAFSANEKDRADNADMYSELVAGPVRSRMTYEQSVIAKSVVPLRVEWWSYDCRDMTKLNPDSATFNRSAVWRNEQRNEAIVEAIKHYSQFGQVLVYVKTVEHIYALRRLYTCPVVHAAQSKEDWEYFVRTKQVPSDCRPLADKDISRISEDFRQGKIRVVIANSVWKRGVDFPKLSTVLIAHGGSSKEEIIQVAGRVSRNNEGKEYGLVVDMRDEFCDTMRTRAATRRRIYKKQLWEQSDAKID